ncbi:Gfo/Idh/MocA family oxidoreductase [Chitinophaga pendula]|uniref:Gfo/Idh/MocA family oxidoreductase n=1 Tax=Chitinophaga TaxID=79328 RepID=UPI000BAF3241|nr:MULTISPECIES: Gfo/Idh/MocA family oxidoreductase [Chitinophaga]ASZ14851.1 oxidoreductase [Chitinophaga sp. MD30]UCJ06121.1 Gfo/Idh/MocA family oxidoreductase [Chitinophaga pendula]
MDKVIKTGICSYGMSGQVFHAPFLHVHPGFEFTAVVERSKHLAQQRYPEVKVYGSVEDMLQDASLELIVVNTPNYTHYDYAKQALLAGKHVIVEKPFTVDVKQGEELIQLSAEKGLLLSVYHNRRYDSDYKIVRKVVESGSLGDLLEVEIHYDRFKEELSYKKHKEIAQAGTGALYDLGSHLIDQALTLFGMPQRLWADIRIIRKDSVVDDYFEVVLYYEQLRVRLKCSYLIREALPAYALHGRKGSFIKTKSDTQEAMLLKGLMPNSPDWGAEAPHEWGLLHTEIDGKIVKQYLPSTNGNYLDYYQGIYDTLRNKVSNPVAPTDGLNVIRIITAAFESSKEGKVITL